MTLHDFLDQARIFLFVPMRILYWPFMLFPVKKNKIIFVNFNGRRGYGCNPKYICEALRRSGEDLDLVWMVKDRSSLPDNVRNVNIKSFRALWEFATARVWVSNMRMPYYIDKKPSQFYLQTWHGCLGFKKIEKDIEAWTPPYYILRSKHDSKMIDLVMQNCTFIKDYFYKVFWYDGPILVEGSARNDMLVNPDENLRNRVKEKLGVSNDTNIFLYAPTHRVNTDINMFKLPFDDINKVLEHRFGGKWVSLVRLHPAVLAGQAGQLKYSKTVLNGSVYPDMQELMAASDFMVTDYSSCVFDYMVTRRPAALYCPDLEQYEHDWDFQTSPRDLPFALTEKPEDLIKAIETFDMDQYSTSLEDYFNSVGLNETGHASEALANIILKQIKGV